MEPTEVPPYFWTTSLLADFLDEFEGGCSIQAPSVAKRAFDAVYYKNKKKLPVLVKNTVQSLYEHGP